MPGRTAVLVLLIFCAAFVGSSLAQQNNELTAIIGRTIISDGGVLGVSTFDPVLHSGKGLTLEANYAHTIKTLELVSFTVEVPVLINFEEKIHFSQNIVPKNYRSVFITPALRASLAPQMAISPWVSIGGGYGHFSYNSSLEFFGSNPGPGSSNTGVFQIGTGFDVKILRWAKLRGEVRDFYSGVPDLNVNLDKGRQHNLFAGGGFVFLF